MIRTKLGTFDVKTISQQIVPRTLPVYAPGRVEAREQVHSRAISRQNNNFSRGMIFMVLVIITFTFCAALNIKSHSEMHLEQQKQGVLNAEVQQMQEANMALAEEINNLRNDPATIERAARQRLNMVRANERILVPAN
jgi:cell division protein FtsB